MVGGEIVRTKCCLPLAVSASRFIRPLHTVHNGVPVEATQQQLMFVGVSLACAGVGSLYDALQRRIPNYVSSSGIVAGLALHTILGGWSGLGSAALAGSLAGCVFLLFYAAGGMGAGDVKLMTAVGCLCGLGPLPTVIIATAIAGAVFGIAFSVACGRVGSVLHGVGVLVQHHWSQGLKPHRELNLNNADALRMPYALPIAAGCLFTLCDLAFVVRP